MRHHYTYAALLALWGFSVPADAQSRERDSREERDRTRRTPRVFTLPRSIDADRPRLGVSITSDGRADTLGVLVSDVTADGPAAKAGISRGDRLVAINGVNLRLSAADAEDPETSGLAMRRLTRELARGKAGEEVELRVVRDGDARTLRVKTAAPGDLTPARASLTRLREEREGRASLGIGVGTSGSRRDTLGLLITSVADDGPAAKAGIEEGDRIASVNGVDLRVAPEDGGDWGASTARVRRLNRELENVAAGAEVELRLVRGGAVRTLRVKTVAAREIARPGGFWFSGDGAHGMRIPMPPTPPVPPSAAIVPGLPTPPAPPAAPFPPDPPRWFYSDDEGWGDIRLRMGPDAEAHAREAIERAMERALELRGRFLPRLRIQLDDIDDDGVVIERRGEAPRVRIRATGVAS